MIVPESELKKSGVTCQFIYVQSQQRLHSERIDHVFSSFCSHTNDIVRLFLFQGTNYVDENVTANKEYEYRVSAVNDAGAGEPSDSSGTIAAKPEKGETHRQVEMVRWMNSLIG